MDECGYSILIVQKLMLECCIAQVGMTFWQLHTSRVFHISPFPFQAIPYSRKFSRGPVFTVFVDDSLTAKFKAMKINSIIQHIMGMSAHICEN